MKTERGFTLIELLVVISIISILSVVGLVVYSGVQSKARDSIRKGDLNALATALELYMQTNKSYVTKSNPIGDITDCTDTTFYNTPSFISYMSSGMPKDPSTQQAYCYITSNSGQYYRLYAQLENCTASGGNLCGWTWNYSISSNNLTPAVTPAPSDTFTSPPPTPTITPTTTPIPTPPVTPTPTPSPTPAPTVKYVFYSGTQINGNLGGVSGADAACQSWGNSSSHPGIYQAWISDSTSSPATRFITHSSFLYVLFNGITIANNWADLTSGSIRAPINIDQGGGSHPTYYAWTNTLSNGTSAGSFSNCNNWTNSTTSFLGVTGENWVTNSSWTDFTSFNQSCPTPVNLYCFQQ